MADFINTIDLLGEETTLKMLVEKTITEFKDNVINNTGNGAFYSCKELTRVDLPNVTNIGQQSFWGCTKLTEVDLPNVTNIYAQAFRNCESLIALIVRSETLCSLNSTYTLDGTPIASGTGCIYVPKALVDSYKAATNWSTFANQFRELEQWTLDGTVSGELGHRVRFFNEDGTLLKSVVVRTGDDAVYDGDEPVKEGEWEFNGWNPAPTNITGDTDCYAQFRSTELMSKKLVERTLRDYVNDRVTSIGHSAFGECSALTNVNMPNVTSIGDNAFYYCRALTSVDFLKVTSIGNNAFYYCYALTNVNMPNVTSIGNKAFYYCSALTSVDFLKVTSIGNNAFNGCTMLSTLILRNVNRVCTLDGNGIFNTPIASGNGYIYVPRALVDSYKAATNWSNYANQFRALEDYTVDGTITGELDSTKI